MKNDLTVYTSKDGVTPNVKKMLGPELTNAAESIFLDLYFQLRAAGCHEKNERLIKRLKKIS